MPNPTPNSVLPLAREDLACYAIAQWPPFELAAHHRVICDKLEAVERGEIKRLMIFLPPRHGKSTLATQFFPAWYLGRHPERSVISASYGQDLADDFGRKVRNLIGGPMHSNIFPTCRLAEDSAAMRRFNTTAGGSYYAVGRGAAITGRGADLLLLDDPLKDREEAQSETIRKSLNEWFSHVAYTRLQPGGAVVLIETRWHEDDLAGRLLGEHADENWVVVSLPALAEKDDSFRRAGEALWPERFPLQVLEQIRAAVGSAAWASLYQQRPAAAEGAIFKRDWLRTYRELPEKFERIVQSWDTAFKTGAENDYSVCTTWGSTNTGHYLLSFWRGRVEFPELKRQVSIQADQWRPNAILVEDKASGQSLIQELKLATAFPILPVRVDSDKRTRAEAVTPLFEAGRVLLPESAPWLLAYVDELAVFPAGTHDDAVDSTTQALNYIRDSAQVYGLTDLINEEVAKRHRGNTSDSNGGQQQNMIPYKETNTGCPKCSSNRYVKANPLGIFWRCNSCQFTWRGPQPTGGQEPQSRPVSSPTPSPAVATAESTGSAGAMLQYHEAVDVCPNCTKAGSVTKRGRLFHCSACAYEFRGPDRSTVRPPSDPMRPVREANAREGRWGS